jgi:hypothetical protein
VEAVEEDHKEHNWSKCAEVIFGPLRHTLSDSDRLSLASILRLTGVPSKLCPIAGLPTSHKCGQEYVESTSIFPSGRGHSPDLMCSFVGMFGDWLPSSVPKMFSKSSCLYEGKSGSKSLAARSTGWVGYPISWNFLYTDR